MWWFAKLNSLSATFMDDETNPNHSDSVWRKRSVSLLLAGTFVWLDDLESTYYEAYDKGGLNAWTNAQGNDRSLNVAPFLPPIIQVLVFEGFGHCLASSPSPYPADSINSKDAVGTAEWRTVNAQKAANARHSQPGGSRDKKEKIRKLWKSGKYSTRDICAEQECGDLNISFSAARKALTNIPASTKIKTKV